MIIFEGSSLFLFVYVDFKHESFYVDCVKEYFSFFLNYVGIGIFFKEALGNKAFCLGLFMLKKAQK